MTNWPTMRSAQLLTATKVVAHRNVLRDGLKCTEWYLEKNGEGSCFSHFSQGKGLVYILISSGEGHVNL